MRLLDEPLPGAFLIEGKSMSDQRGLFVKTFHKTAFQEMGINFVPEEEFYSVSDENVLRGMHFQLPPYDHAKLVYCTHGRALDVLVDLRKGRPTFGRSVAIELSSVNHRMFYVPSGIAHGFLALAPDTLMMYKTTVVHSPSHDAGIRWDSFGFDWGTLNPVASVRDAGLPALADFVSPF